MDIHHGETEAQSQPRKLSGRSALGTGMGRREDGHSTLDFGNRRDKMETLEVASHLRASRFPVTGGGVCSLTS
jgi:hypothetical protein